VAAATLLTDAFSEAVSYWRESGGGTRAGLIQRLQNRLAVTQETAGRWVDAMMQEAYDLAIIDEATYPSFKARLLQVGPVRALNGAQCIFEQLRRGALSLDARDEKVAQYDVLITELQTRLAAVNAALGEVAAFPGGVFKTEATEALNARVVRVVEKIAYQQAQRDLLAAQSA